MTNAKDFIASVRQRLNQSSSYESRQRSVTDRYASPPTPLVPEPGKREGEARRTQFIAKAQASGAEVKEVTSPQALVKAMRDYCHDKGLRPALRFGEDERLAALPWAEQAPDLKLVRGASSGDDEITLSYALAGIAENGSLVLISGKDNPTSLTLLGTHHLVVLDEADLKGSLEEGLTVAGLGIGTDPKAGKAPPRHVAVVTGPSRSADIEQTLLMGAHGPKHVLILLLSKT